MLHGFASLCQGVQALGKGDIRNGLVHLARAGESNFETFRPILELAGFDKKKLEIAGKLLESGKEALENVAKGLDHLDGGQYREAVQAFIHAGGDALQAVYPLVEKAAGKAAKFLGPLAKSAGNLVAISDKLALLVDSSASIKDRLGAAQVVFSTIGVEGIRNLASVAFGERAGNAMAETAQFVADATIQCDQETAKRWDQARNMDSMNWNRSTATGKQFAALKGYQPPRQGMTTAELQESQLMGHIPERWASRDPRIRRAMNRVISTLRVDGSETAKDSYLEYAKKWHNEQLVQRTSEAP